MPPLRLLTLGRCELRRVRPDGPFDVLPLTGKPMGLLLRLASAGNQLLSRDMLANELWSELDRERGLAQFRTALWSLRKHFPPEAILADDSSVALTEPIATDRADFQTAVRSGDYTTAVALYRGDFLAQFAISGAQGFEEWVEFERRNLRGLFIGAAIAEAQRLILSARFGDAVALAARARDAEPLNQGVWRALLQALISAGDVVSARAEASAFVALHAEERFAIEPDTSRLLRLASTAVPAPAGSESTPGLEAELVGRERELAGLLELVDRTRRGRPNSACISGPPGIGKTRLVHDFGRSASAHRATVISVAAPRATQRVPYGTVARLAERLANLRGALGISAASASVLVGLHPTLSSVYQSAPTSPGPADHGARLLAFVELVSAVAEETTLVLIVDDAQWLDDASREIVHALPESCADASLLLVVSARGPAAPALGFAPTATFALEPLSPNLTEAMVGSIAKLPDAAWAAEWVHALHGSARGIPLGVLDVTRLGVERSVVEIRDGSWECSDPAALLRLTEAAAPREARIAQLPGDARRLAVALALVGTPVRLGTVAAVLNSDESTLATAIRVLVERGIAQVEAESLSLTHEEYSAAAAAAANPDDRQTLRAGFAEQFADEEGTDALRRAYALAEEAEHYPLADRIAARYLRLARKRTPKIDARAAMADLIGLGARATRLEELVGRHDRQGRLRRRAAAWAAGAAMLTATAYAASRLAAPPAVFDATVSVEIHVDDSLLVAGVPVSLNDWSTTRPIRIDARRAVAVGTTAMRTLTGSPADTTKWLAVESRNDRVTDDIVLLQRGAPPRYVASWRGDDVSPAWAPNGDRVAFITARWAGDRGAVAIADLRTDSVMRLPAGEGVFDIVEFRSDGAGVAFTRRDRDGRNRAICAMRLSDARPRCRAATDAVSITSVAWPSVSTVYYAQSDGIGGAYLRAWDIALDSVRSVAACLGPAINIDALGGFSICRGSDRAPGVTIAPIARPDQMRRVEVFGVPRDGVGDVRVVSSNRPRTLRPLELSPRRDPVVGVPHLLRAIRRGTDSAAPEPASVTWSVVSGDATISEAGALTTRRPGAVTLVASDGVARDTLRLTARANSDLLLLDERWTPDWRARWRLFGSPLPEVVEERGTRAFWNAGDGIYFSGAYTATEWDASAGVAADFDLSTPITADTSQLIRIGLRSGGDSAVMAGWDHTTGYGPGTPRQWWCKFQFPTGDREPSESRYAAGSGDARANPAMWHGARYHVRIQTFPDGRCGVALNGKPIALSNEGGTEPTARFYIDGSSVKTRILVFGLTVRRGVPGGVDWPVK